MSEINSQIKINIIESIKDQSVGTKTSLEKLNNILQELHKNVMKESNSNVIIKSSNKEEKNNIEEENNNNENSDFINEIKRNEQDKERTTSDNVGDNNNDKISGKNLIKIKISGEYKNSSDINLINKKSIDYNNIMNTNQKEKNEVKEEKDSKQENQENDIIKEGNNEIKEENKDIKEDIKEENKEVKEEKEKREEENNKENKEENISSKKNDELNNENNNNDKDILDKYSFRPLSEVTMSSIEQTNINSFNMTKGSELNLNVIIDKLDDKVSEKESEGLTDSVKIDPNEVIHLGITNFQIPSDEGTPSVITNELDKACIKTNDYTKSKDIISNIDSSGLQREIEKPNNIKNELNQENGSLNASTNINNINDKKSGIDILFGKEKKKDEKEIIRENRREIEKGINKMYEKELNLVKINNKEKFSYITKYNDPDKDKLGYESDYFFCSKNSINFLNRRNNWKIRKYY